MVALYSGPVLLAPMLDVGSATTVMVAVCLIVGWASLAAVKVQVCAVPGAVQVVLVPLFVVAGLKEPPQLSVQSTDVSEAFETVADAVAVNPTLTVPALFVIALMETACGVTVTELSAFVPAPFVARSQ